MTRLASALVVLAATLSIHAQPPLRDSIPRTGSAVIRGRVISAETGDSVRKARVTTAIDGGSPARVFTDGDGRFEIPSLPAGRYGITVSKAGYATTRYGARRTSERPLVVDVADAAIVN